MIHLKTPLLIACAGLLTLATVTAADAASSTTHPAYAPSRAAAAARISVAANPTADSTGASDISNLGSGGWQVQSSAAATQSGAQISAPGFNASSWLPVANDDAGAPGTEIEALAQNGRCPGDTSLQPVNQSSDGTSSIFYSDNLKLCYGSQGSIGADSVKEFDVPWWWRTTFTGTAGGGQYATLIVNGVIGAANVWLDGKELATSATVTGDYTRFTFPITSDVVTGTNAVAVEVLPNNPQKMFTLDDVDWNQIPPDNNTGIQFPVQLETDGALSDGNAYVTQNDSANLSSAALTVKCDITNHSSSSQSGTVTATVMPPGGGSPVTVSQAVTVPASTTDTVTFSPSYPALTISNPQVWWPYQLGSQPLYTLGTSVAQSGSVLNSTTETFGIRTVTSYLTGSSSAEPSGARAFKVNGVPIVIRGGGWSPNILLHYSASDLASQIALIKNMGLNAIRLEGHFMPNDFYQQMDAAGILVNAGFQCCDAWQLQDSGLTSTADYNLLSNSALTLGENLRNDPSVFSFQWSDNEPTSEQESVTASAFAQAGFDDPLIASAEYKSVSPLGASGEKEGPYDWVPPDYWYSTESDSGDSSQTNAGGAWGYDSEESAGDTIPTMDSLSRFMTASALSRLWQSPNGNQYHLNYESGCGSYQFGTPCHFSKALDEQYGTPTSLSQYVEEAQAQEYQDVQSQFEAFINNANATPLPSTGTIYWQMNKGFPSMLWNLYNSDGDQAGSYFGAQEADRSLHALYALSNGTVTLDNLSGQAQSGLSVTAKVYNLAGTVLNSQTASGISLASQQVKNGVLTPVVPATTKPPTAAQTYFVELVLSQNGSVVDRNVYWLSTQANVVNWNSTLDQSYAVMSQWADLQALQSLPKAAVAVTASTTSQAGPDGANLATTVKITNTSSTSAVAFLLRADVRRGNASGTPVSGDSELQSSIWNGNDITLWPGESQTLTVTYDSSDLDGDAPVITVSGWNVPTTDTPAPAP